ncbi:PREDICTED: GATA zinc finger domain-containing protein 14 [Prunus mume]|uniref:GATA zinc finger domain-containing protein 14 n=1 Tax=Prunus mume TaxID=102107 RepID=A0ABM1LP58_PRUMU|nr:PREDICTED: GATA zinc finger domain-containing protein 14 [Prunus mume]
MAPFAKSLSFFFLLVLIFSSENTQARESVFFSNVTHYNNNNKNVNEPTISTSIAEVPTPALSPAAEAPELADVPAPAAEAPELADVPAPAPSYLEKEHRHKGALYGLGSGKSPSTEKTPTTIDGEDEILAEELSGESFDRTGNYESTNLHSSNGYKTNYVNNNNYVNGNGYKTNYVNNNNYVNGNGYKTNYVNNNNYVNGNGYKTNYVNNNNNNNNYVNGNGYKTNYVNNNYINGNGYTKTNNYKGSNGWENREINAQQGMSDTRFLENGRYYHENYEAGRGSNRNYVQNTNEFNTMEEYDKYQERRGYVP